MAFLNDEIRDELKKEFAALTQPVKLILFDQPIHFQVFVTPTCPYCPPAVRLAHQFAMESDLVRADMIEATEFPELSESYGVMGVPRTVINDQHYFEGALPESYLLQALQQAIGKKS